MALTSAQLAALKTAIVAKPTWNALPNTSDGNFELARLLNQTASPTFTVWRTEVPRKLVMDTLDTSKYTPNSALDDTGLAVALTAEQRATQILQSQIKVMLLDLLLRDGTIDTSRVNVRKGLQDAVVKSPTGAAGSNVHPCGAADGAPTLAVCTRPATEIEKILATASHGSDTTGSVTARVMGFEGSVTAQDVETARNLP